MRSCRSAQRPVQKPGSIGFESLPAAPSVWALNHVVTATSRKDVDVAGVKQLLVQGALPVVRPLNRMVVRRRYRRAASSGFSTAPFPPHQGPVLLCAPHVDDESIAAGGLLLAWHRQGVPVDLAYLTDSSAGGKGESAAERASIRRAEAEELARRTGVRSLHVLPGVNENLLATAAEVTSELAEILERGGHQVVVTVGPLDAHHEHRECAAIVRDALVRVGFPGPVYVGENSNLLPLPLVTHHHALTESEAADRAGLFDIFRSQTTMGFEVYSDLARAKAPLAPGSHALELFHRTDAPGFSRLVDAVAALDLDALLPARIGNSWSFLHALTPDDSVMTALAATGWKA